MNLKKNWRLVILDLNKLKKQFKIKYIMITIFVGGCSSMEIKQKQLSYLDWKPAIKAEEVFEQTVGFSYLSTDTQNNLFWVENRPEESGRSVLVMKDKNGILKDVIPTPFSTRSRVFEYGSYSYTVAKDWVYFVNFKDQRIYKISLSQTKSIPEPITVEKNMDGTLGKYADLSVSPDGRWLLFAYEKDNKQGEAINEIGLIDLKENKLQEAKIIVSGADFYKSPQFSPDGSKIAWIEWNHPYMPWDSTLLYEAPFSEGNLNLNNKNHVAGSKTSSISQYCYTSSGDLVFGADFANQDESSPKNFYNLYKYQKGHITHLTQSQLDFFQFRCQNDSIYSLAFENGKAKLFVFDLKSKNLKNLEIEPIHFSVPIPSGQNIYLVGMFENVPSQILEITQTGKSKTIKKSSEQAIDPKNVSKAIPISYPTEDGQKSYGYFYPPTNSKYTAPRGELPPVRVLIHGGPTGMTAPGFSKQIMFWTSQGYAIFDVNYRGSIGFGRAYRDALLKKWGLVEIQDVKDGLTYLKNKGYISGQAVVSGGSAGGYSVQRLLTFYPDLFSAGASHYGIGNLVTLQQLTHKFESHYLEQLIGGTLSNNKKEYEGRSPINHLDKLKSPMIIFQGSDDKVVPPENSREMAEILKKKGIHHEYYEYPGEDHGFRKKENLIDSLEKESLFFKNILNAKN